MSNYDEINDQGRIDFNSCTPLGECGIGITISEAWGDWGTKRRHILVRCEGGAFGVEYSMDVDKAEALGLLLCSAARGMRSLAASVDRDLAEEDKRLESEAGP